MGEFEVDTVVRIMNRTCYIGILFMCCVQALSAQTGCVYGKVLDFNTTMELSNVCVSLLHKGGVEERTFTNELGEYRIKVEKNKSYQLQFDKAEYNTTKESLCLKGKDAMRRDAIIGKPLGFLRITEVGNAEKEIEVIDVGALEVPSSYYVQFFNGGSENIEYRIGCMQEWITEITPSSGILKPNESPVILTIKVDPKKFEAGKTTGKILIKTNVGSRILSVKAIGKFPVLTVLPPISKFTEDPDNLFPDTFRAKIEFEGKHTFEKMGYCFAENNPLPTINDAVVYMNDMGDYSYYAHYADTMAFPWLTMEGGWIPCQRFYVRAFLLYNNENKLVHYSRNVEKFILWDLFCD